VGVEVFHDPNLKPPVLVQKAFEQGVKGGYSVLIVDTAGRSQMDETLMDELKSITKKVTPADTLLVVDSMIGQEALHIAEGFRDTVSLSGLILTKMDGDSRGGAAISIRSVTGVPIKFLGVGEGIEALEVYDPRRLASRILGMGDVIGLIEKAEQAFDLDKSKEQAEKMMSGKFSLEDFASQMKQIRKLGPISQIFDMLPGNLGKAAQQVPPQEAEKQLKLTEAIISSMTREERRNPDLLNASRRRRIARGSGVEVQEVNRVMKNFREAQKLMKTLQKTGGRGLPRLFG
jgi:signal recognition particle subunit SRP54